MQPPPPTRPAPIPTEYTGVRRRTRTVRSGRQRSHQAVRFFFFGLAATWGFVVGVVTALVLIGAEGSGFQGGAGRLWWLLPAAGAAVLGGTLVSAAYRESRKRLR